MAKIIPLKSQSRQPVPERLVREFLDDLESAGKSRHTITNYRSDLLNFFSSVQQPLEKITHQMLKTHFQKLEKQAPATRARKQASLQSFFSWCVKNEYLPINPMDKVERITLAESMPRGVERKVIEKILAAIPKDKLRDRLLFTLVAETGVRISEALGIYAEDLSLSPDDEKIIIKGKAKKTRTVMLYAAPESLKLLKRYLRESGIKSGALFRGDERKGGSKRPLHYRTAHHLWSKYCRKAKVQVKIHALRHSFATELINEGVSLAVVRKVLGHKNMQTTLRYAEVSDATVKTELMEKHRRSYK